MPSRQEVLNVLLAQLLREHGVIASPEQIVRTQGRSSRAMPDVLVDFQGLRLAIEGEVDNQGAEARARRMALRRLEQNIAHIAIAVVYPRDLRSVGFDVLKSRLATTPLRYAIITEVTTVRATQLQLFPEQQDIEWQDVSPFMVGPLDALVDALRRTYGNLVQDEVLEEAVSLLETGIEGFLHAVSSQVATTDRFTSALGIRVMPDDTPRRSRRPRQAVNRIAALILLNAMMFQEVLAKQDRRVKPLQQFRYASPFISELCDHWQFILTDINYFPIFHIANQLLSSLAADTEITQSIQRLVNIAFQIVGWRVALRHDLAGRIYHRLLAEAKYLGAYYTSIPAATLLLKLALRPETWAHRWSDQQSLQNWRVADLSCGTGTLLMAAAEVITDNYIRACAEAHIAPDFNTLQRVLVEHSLYGFDVLASAVHLTASTLAFRVPDLPINVTHLYSLPFGGVDSELGSLEFLQQRTITGTIFAASAEASGQSSGSVQTVELPDLDLCVMNPPFTSSRQPNLLFGSLPTPEREQMQRKLQRLVRDRHVSASITAGLAAIFVALADRYVKPNGRLALVLPRSLVAGVAWARTRHLLSERYQLEYLIACHEPGHWNFSENTALSEVLVIARKYVIDQPDEPHDVICVNLWRHPRNAIEALSIARTLMEGDMPRLQTSQGVLSMAIGATKFGEAFTVSWADMGSGLWTFPCAFAQAELVRAFYALHQGKLYVPSYGFCGDLPLCDLGQLAELGPDPRDVYDGFELADDQTVYPALWGHEADRFTTLNQRPNRYLEPLVHPRPRRHLRRATDLWSKAGRLLIAQRPRINTKHVTAVRVSEKVLADVWWPVVLNATDGTQEEAEKILVLWLNSTPGLILLLGHREETQGAWMQFKKPALGQMPVLDPGQLTIHQRRNLADSYDRLANLSLKPFPLIDRDPMRAAIDDALVGVLHLPRLTVLRQLLAREPLLSQTLDRLTGPS